MHVSCQSFPVVMTRAPIAPPAAVCYTKLSAYVTYTAIIYVLHYVKPNYGVTTWHLCIIIYFKYIMHGDVRIV